MQEDRRRRQTLFNKTRDTAVFDLSGRLVRSAPKAAYDSGEHAWQWDGRDQTGAPVRAGLYFFVVRTGESTQSGKIAIVR